MNKSHTIKSKSKKTVYKDIITGLKEAQEIVKNKKTAKRIIIKIKKSSGSSS